nr:MAG TPA: hypothetical protein [Caudoviricetes sp.]
MIRAVQTNKYHDIKPLGFPSGLIYALRQRRR